ncbi:MAG: hypothetical protein JW946_02180 [Candidatus Omnitrophica bacterium]|nr:hypothetical protein [Candidatus Omnitrophota bacterium]
MEQNRRKNKIIQGPIQKKLLLLVFFAAVIPAGIITVCLYYLIFNLLAWQIGIPEAVAYNLIPVAQKVNLIIMITIPIALIIIWVIALELSHRIAGPIYRLEKDLDAIIAGTKKGPIQLRKNDLLKELADKINKAIR